jgi:DNA-binding transcriptional regulator YdaS (Cro superfamily)
VVVNGQAPARCSAVDDRGGHGAARRDAGRGDEAEGVIVDGEVDQREREVALVGGERAHGARAGLLGGASPTRWRSTARAGSARRRSSIVRSVSSVTTHSMPPTPPPSSGTGLYENVW